MHSLLQPRYIHTPRSRTSAPELRPPVVQATAVAAAISRPVRPPSAVEQDTCGTAFIRRSAVPGLLRCLLDRLTRQPGRQNGIPPMREHVVWLPRARALTTTDARSPNPVSFKRSTARQETVAAGDNETTRCSRAVYVPSAATASDTDRVRSAGNAQQSSTGARTTHLNTGRPGVLTTSDAG